CTSGQLIETGYVPITERVKLDAPALKGRVVITSSSAKESSMESDRIGGSYFTHHLVAAMRGAADSGKDPDGRVTLTEALEYAEARTIESTCGTLAGSQHPHRAIDLQGQGDVVLSELDRSSGKIDFDVEEAGRWLVAQAGAPRVFELEKPGGRRTFAVQPGTYR